MDQIHKWQENQSRFPGAVPMQKKVQVWSESKRLETGRETGG